MDRHCGWRVNGIQFVSCFTACTYKGCGHATAQTLPLYSMLSVLIQSTVLVARQSVGCTPLMELSQ